MSLLLGWRFAHRDSSPDNDYTYDDLDRLVEVGYYNDEDEEFTYDKLGNRETVKMRKGGDVDYQVNDLVNQYAGIGAPPGHWKLNDKPGGYAIDATNDYLMYRRRLARTPFSFQPHTPRPTPLTHLTIYSYTHPLNNHDWQVLAEYDDAGYHLRSYIYGATLSPLQKNEP